MNFTKSEKLQKITKKIIKHHHVTSTPKTLRKLSWNHLTVFWLNFDKNRRFLFVMLGPSPNYDTCLREFKNFVSFLWSISESEFLSLDIFSAMVQRLTFRRTLSYNTSSNRKKIVKTPGGKLVYQHISKAVSFKIRFFRFFSWKKNYWSKILGQSPKMRWHRRRSPRCQGWPTTRISPVLQETEDRFPCLRWFPLM